MQDDSTTAPAARPGASLLSAAIAAGGTVAMTAGWAALLPMARTGHGEDALLAWVLVALAGVGALLCLHLTLVWAMAALVLFAGPASRTGAALLTALHLLAPRVARRVTLGAALATTATGLVLAPALASEGPPPPGPEHASISRAPMAELRPAEAPTPDPEAAAAGSAGEDGAPDGSAAPLPPLGWGDQPAPADTGPSASATPSGSENPDGPGGPAPGAPLPRTVTVERGDSLWSITDDLLGPAPDSISAIAASWPQLHEANRHLIGPDPDRLLPGQELTVPTPLTPQDQP